MAISLALALPLLLAASLRPVPANVRGDEATGEWGQVVGVIAPHMLRVQNERGERYVVWHIGLIGPPASDTDATLYSQAVQAHADLLPAGTWIWLQAEPALADEDPEVRLRHVFVPPDLQTPIGASLARAGWVRIYPNALHAYTAVYASEQAEAVLARAGAWAYTDVSSIFIPSDLSSGGLPTSRRLLPALNMLDASAIGHQVLLEISRFPVTVEVQPLPASGLAHFSYRMYSIQLSPGIAGAEPESLAAELLHELTHAQQLVREKTSGETVDCYAGELEAASATARYWFSLYGPEGKVRLTHSLDAWLNRLNAMYQSGELESSVRSRYYDQCEDLDSQAGL